MTSRLHHALLLAIGPDFYDGALGNKTSKLEFYLLEVERAVNPKSNHERLKVQPRYTAMKARTKR